MIPLNQHWTDRLLYERGGRRYSEWIDSLYDEASEFTLAGNPNRTFYLEHIIALVSGIDVFAPREPNHFDEYTLVVAMIAARRGACGMSTLNLM